jgi:exodeoxyribonuclease-1
LPAYFAQITALRSEHQDNPASLALLDALDQWGNDLQTTL